MSAEMTRKHVVVVDGVEYEAQFASIEETFLGWSDEGQLVALVQTSAGTFGKHLLSTNVQWISELLTTVGVRQWEALKGVAVLLLSEGGKPAGVAHPVNDRVMVFDPERLAPRADVTE